MLVPGFWILASEFWLLNSEFWILDSGFWLLVPKSKLSVKNRFFRVLPFGRCPKDRVGISNSRFQIPECFL